MAKSVRKDLENETAAEISSAVQTPVDWQVKIAELAYLKAETRGFTPGHELNDWLEAEQELASS